MNVPVSTVPRARVLWAALCVALATGSALAQEANLAPDLAVDCLKSPDRVPRAILPLEEAARPSKLGEPRPHNVLWGERPTAAPPAGGRGQQR